MKKNYIFGIAAALMMGTVALSSCSNDELTVKNEVQQAEVAKTYSFSVPASMDDGAGTRWFTLGESTISSKFDENENVYVFIKDSEGKFAYGNSPLTPKNVSEDGSTCTFEANGLEFIPDDQDFELTVGDEVYLYYGMTVEPDSNPLEGYFDFATDGSKAKAQSMDYNLAMTTIKSADGGVLTFNDTFNFTNINSIFRQKLTFKEGSTTVTPTIKKFVIYSNNMIVKRYYPFGRYYAYEYGTIETGGPDDNGNIYFSLIFNHDNNDVDITFTAIDSEGKTYTYTKLGYPRGFKNNNYYYGDAELELLDGIITPNISGVKEYEAVEVSDDNLYMKYKIYDNPVNLFISGKSEQNLFQLNYDGTVTLNNLNASHSSNNAFINSSHEVSLVLSGNNNITCNENDVCIWVSELILSCTGESATLTLTNNSYDWESGGIGGSISAADGFSVECSGPNPNYDEFHPTSPLSYSTKYTVTKNP